MVLIKVVKLGVFLSIINFIKSPDGMRVTVPVVKRRGLQRFFMHFYSSLETQLTTHYAC